VANAVTSHRSVILELLYEHSRWKWIYSKKTQYIMIYVCGYDMYRIQKYSLASWIIYLSGGEDRTEKKPLQTRQSECSEYVSILSRDCSSQDNILTWPMRKIQILPSVYEFSESEFSLLINKFHWIGSTSFYSFSLFLLRIFLSISYEKSNLKRTENINEVDQLDRCITVLSW